MKLLTATCKILAWCFPIAEARALKDEVTLGSLSLKDDVLYFKDLGKLMCAIIMKSTGVLTLSEHIHYERHNSYVVHCTCLAIMMFW